MVIHYYLFTNKYSDNSAHIILQVVQQFGIPHLFDLPIQPTVCSMISFLIIDYPLKPVWVNKTILSPDLLSLPIILLLFFLFFTECNLQVSFVQPYTSQITFRFSCKLDFTLPKEFQLSNVGLSSY